MIKPKFFYLLFLVLFSPGVLAQEGTNCQTPAAEGPSFRMMKTAGFWISRHPSPDAAIMDHKAIDQFNGRLRDDRLTKDIFTFAPKLKNETLLKGLKATLSKIMAKNLYTSAGVRNDEDFMARIKHNMDLNGRAESILPRYGMVVHYVSQFFLPTEKGLYSQKTPPFLDFLENTSLDTGTPVAVVHTSVDGHWYYVLSATSAGWVESENIALGNVRQVSPYAQSKNFVVVIRPKADIFMDPGMTEDYDYVRMGTRLPLLGAGRGRVMVNVPVKNNDGTLTFKKGYMDPEDVSIGYLSFTARNIYKQALRMLNQPYAWRDMYGEQDCSKFLQIIFATFGFILPRDVQDQAKISNSTVDFTKKTGDDLKTAVIAKAPAATTFLILKKHIMLYLGMVDGKPYVIQDTTGHIAGVDYAIDGVIVSDLSLGEGCRRGSILKQIIRIETIP